MAAVEEIWGKLFTLLSDPKVSEFQCNGPASFFVKMQGKRLKVPVEAMSEEEYLAGVRDFLAPQVRSMRPWEDHGYLFEGPLQLKVGGEVIKGRCHIVQAPAALLPQVTIAKKSASLATLDSIAEAGSMSLDMRNFLRAALAANLTMVFSGGTGAGKTTLLEACSKLIAPEVRIGVAEDSPELLLKQENVTYLQSVPWQPGMNPNDVATLTWVVQQFNRMRVDRIIVGETRGPEFASFLTAANSGMEGSLTTLHANDPRMCLTKMTSLALKGSENAPLRAVNQDIANAVDIIVQLTITPDGRHRVSHIEEVTAVVGSDEKAGITLNNLYKWQADSDRFVRTNSFSDHLRKRFVASGQSVDKLLGTPVNQPQRAGLTPVQGGLGSGPTAARN